MVKFLLSFIFSRSFFQSHIALPVQNQSSFFSPPKRKEVKCSKSIFWWTQHLPCFLQDPYAEGFELCCIAQWFLNHGRLQLAVAAAEDALEILRRAPKPSASQELRALQLLSQAPGGGGNKNRKKTGKESTIFFGTSFFWMFKMLCSFSFRGLNWCDIGDAVEP